jgi:hypothetical protein
MIAHMLKCARFSVGVNVPRTPTSSMSGSFQCCGPARVYSGACTSRISVMPMKQSAVQPVCHESVMSSVVRHMSATGLQSYDGPVLAWTLLELIE